MPPLNMAGPDRHLSPFERRSFEAGDGDFRMSKTEERGLYVLFFILPFVLFYLAPLEV